MTFPNARGHNTVASYIDDYVEANTKNKEKHKQVTISSSEPVAELPSLCLNWY